MKLVLVSLAAVFVLPACGGRASIDPDFGVSTRRMWEQQANNTASKKPLPLTSEDARTVIGNHLATFSKGRSRGSKSGGSTVSSSGGSLAPMTAAIGGEGGGGGASKIKLKAK